MKTTIVSLIGEPQEALYQLGMREKEAFLKLESRVTKLLSTNALLREGQDIISRVKFILKKKESSLFEKCVASYCEGMGIDSARYLSFLSLLELAAHQGQVYPELKSMLPGCSSVFMKENGDYLHARLLDFPLVGIYDEAPRGYYWQRPGKAPVLTMSCEGMAPLFFQGIHGSGVSFALHHKPGTSYHRDGQGIFQILFETLFETDSFTDLKKELKKKASVTKWSFLAMDTSGQVIVTDIDGPSQNTESYNLNDRSPLIFTNIPLKQEAEGFTSYLKFCEDRQNWIKDHLSGKKENHILDTLTSVEGKKQKTWIPSAATLSTVGAYLVNLSKGTLDVKEGSGALTSSDALIRINLGNKDDVKSLKEASKLSAFENAWKRASRAQCFFDIGSYDEAYHELQMAVALMPNRTWKEIFSFYLAVWDFKFVSNTRELSLVYKKLKTLEVPPQLKDQWILLIMRFEKKLDLSPTVTYQNVSKDLQDLYQQEKLASKAVFATWMKLLYPRLEILDVFSPHKR